MNNVSLIGRLTKDPDERQSAGENPTTVTRFTTAVDRFGEGADFIGCVAFGKTANIKTRTVTRYTQPTLLLIAPNL